MFHFSVNDWVPDAGGTNNSVPIHLQHDNEGIPFRSAYYGTVATTAHRLPVPITSSPYINAGIILDMYRVRRAASVILLSLGHPEKSGDFGQGVAETNPAHYVVPKPTAVQPFLFQVPFAAVWTMHLDVIDVDAWMMAGVRSYTADQKNFSKKPANHAELEASMRGLTLAAPTEAQRDKNAIIALAFSGGDLDGTYRQFRKGIPEVKGWPSMQAASTQAQPLAMPGGPNRENDDGAFSAGNAWRGGILVTARGAYSLVGGHGDGGNEYCAVPFSHPSRMPDLTDGAWEWFAASAANEAFGSSDLAGHMGFYSLTVVQWDDEAALQEMMQGGRVLVV